MGGFPEDVRDEARRRSHYTCVLCRRRGFVEVHHIVPASQGGGDDIANACPLCPSCHTDFGANPEKRAFLKQLRDWWWGQCTKQSDEGLERNKQLAQALQELHRESVNEIKAVISAELQSALALVQEAATAEQIGAVSGISTPIAGTVHTQISMTGSLDVHRAKEDRISSTTAPGSTRTECPGDPNDFDYDTYSDSWTAKP